MTDEQPKDFLLTPEKLAEWRCEQVELRKQHRDISIRLRTLERMLEAADVIIGALATTDYTAEGQ